MAQSAIEIQQKWQRYRDSVKRLWLTDKENGERDYIARMKLLQTIIKNAMSSHKIEVVPVILAICEAEEDARLKVQFLAAGYELLIENDFTKTK